jgi:sporadic carbohydrate cluster 2OG-Fe(II) oxygenase
MILDFDNKKFNFKERILKYLKNNLKNKNINLELIHLINDSTQINNIYTLIYSYFNTNEFKVLYDEFCYFLIKNHFISGARYQRIPSVRIQIPKSKSVNFHNDNFYGHGNNIKNIWLPITKPLKTNSLYVCNDNHSKLIINKIKKNMLTIDEINKLSLKYAKPLNIDYGQYFLFNSIMIHGTLKNIENNTRVSIDFRFVEDHNTGLKSYSFFKKVKENKSKKISNAVSYFNKKRLDDSLPSQKYQQLICLEYCKDNNFNNLKLETELSGFNHFPVLKDLIGKSSQLKFRHLVLFSKKNLPKNKIILSEILKVCKSKKITIHLISENKQINYS